MGAYSRPATALREVLGDRPQVDAYESPLGEPGAHHAADDERVGLDDRLRRGEVVTAQHIGRPDAFFRVDEVPAEQNEVLGGEGVDEGLVVNVDLTELGALQQSDEDVHIPIMPSSVQKLAANRSGDLGEGSAWRTSAARARADAIRALKTAENRSGRRLGLATPPSYLSALFHELLHFLLIASTSSSYEPRRASAKVKRSFPPEPSWTTSPLRSETITD